MIPIHFLKTLTVLLGILLFSILPVYAASVGKIVVAKEYNDILRGWIDRRLGLQISDGEIYGVNGPFLVFISDTGLGEARTYTKISESLQENLESIVGKAIKWAKIAQKNKADVHKVISCIGKYAEACMQHGRVDRNHLLFEFSAQKGGKQTNLIITIVDLDYKYKNATLYLGLPEMNQLLGNIRKIDIGLEEYYTQRGNEVLFN